LGRTYDQIPWDTAESQSDPIAYFFPEVLFGLDYSPVPYLTLGGELMVPPILVGAWGAGVKVKAVPLTGENMAAALLLKAGANLVTVESEDDFWGPDASYNTQYLVGGGIVSFGNPTISAGVGPKLVFSHVDITGDNTFHGNVIDYGGFLNLIMNYNFIGLSGELSMLSIDRPNAGTRSLLPYTGITLKLMF